MSSQISGMSGTKQVKYLEQNAAAFFVKLSKEEVEYLSDLFKPEFVSHPHWQTTQKHATRIGPVQYKIQESFIAPRVVTLLCLGSASCVSPGRQQLPLSS